jgi:hypothetical protein
VEGVEGVCATESKAKEEETALVVEFSPALDHTIAERWIDLAYVDWQDNDSDQIFQIEGLIQKYQQMGSEAYTVNSSGGRTGWYII